jgi:hypothetical protein
MTWSCRSAAIVEHRRALLLGAGLGQLDREGRVVGEAARHLDVGGAERGAPAEPGRGEHALRALRPE